MSLTNLSQKSLLKILNCNAQDSKTIRKLRRTRFALNKLVTDAHLHKYMAEEVRIQADQELHMANNMIVALRNRVQDGAQRVDPLNAEGENLRDEEHGNLLADVAADLQALPAEAVQAARGSLYITLRKAEPVSRTPPTEDDIDYKEMIYYRNPYYFFSPAPDCYEGLMGYAVNAAGISEPLIHRPDYIHREAGYVDPKDNNTRLCRIFGKYMNQVRELKMLSIFNHQIDKDFVEKFEALNIGYSQISKLNLQCVVELTQRQFEEFIELFHLDSILLRCVFTKEISLEEMLMNISERIVIEISPQDVVHQSVGRLTGRLLSFWKENPPRQIRINTKVDWTLAELWDFIQDIVRQDLPVHRRATYYSLGHIVASTEEWTGLAAAMMRRGYSWKVAPNSDLRLEEYNHYEVKSRRSQVTFAFDIQTLNTVGDILAVHDIDDHDF